MRSPHTLTSTRGVRARAACLVAGAAAVVALSGCDARSSEVVHVEAFPLDIGRAFIPDGPVTMDPYLSWDGKGSLRIQADSAVVVPVVDLTDVDVEDAILVYEAKVRTRELDGLAYLEMSCRLPMRGTFYSRGLRAPLTGSQGWASQHVRFNLRPGEVPEAIRLSLVLTGPGTAWIDAVSLLRFEPD